MVVGRCSDVGHGVKGMAREHDGGGVRVGSPPPHGVEVIFF